MKTLDFYACGIVYASVCAPAEMSREEVAAQANRQEPTGISSCWSVSEDTHFNTGQTNPCQCENDATRKHWLLSC